MEIAPDLECHRPECRIWLSYVQPEQYWACYLTSLSLFAFYKMEITDQLPRVVEKVKSGENGLSLGSAWQRATSVQ